MIELEEKTIQEFQKKIFSWWKKNKRDLPWRRTTNPYFILVSEVMLQQTQVSRTIEKYLEFIEKFPNLEELANASIADVLKTWSGLGYNRRALWLQEAAKQIIELGKFPKSPEELIKLKGIGPYTSRSILIFAFNEDLQTVDTNIRRIMISEGFAKEGTSEKELFQIAKKLLPKGKSCDWHNALMDYGSLELTVAKTGIKPITVQPKFKKSSRYHRGKIIKFLIKNREVEISELMEFCELSKKECEKIITSLLKDGLIMKKEEKYSLP